MFLIILHFKTWENIKDNYDGMLFQYFVVLYCLNYTRVDTPNLIGWIRHWFSPCDNNDLQCACNIRAILQYCNQNRILSQTEIGARIMIKERRTKCPQKLKLQAENISALFENAVSKLVDIEAMLI